MHEAPLLPCPFCGSTHLQDARGNIGIECAECGAVGPTIGRAGPTEWNDRHDLREDVSKMLADAVVTLSGDMEQAVASAHAAVVEEHRQVFEERREEMRREHEERVREMRDQFKRW